MYNKGKINIHIAIIKEWKENNLPRACLYVPDIIALWPFRYPKARWS